MAKSMIPLQPGAWETDWNRNQRNLNVAKIISATESQEAGFKEKLMHRVGQDWSNLAAAMQIKEF